MKKVNLYNVVETEEIERSVLSVLRSGHLSAGQLVSKFENLFSEFNGSNHVIACSDMTSALELILKISGIGGGDEVLTSPFACLSTNSAIATSGAHAVWIDNKKDSIFLDVKDIEQKITSKTKALLLYHIAGYVCNIDEIVDLCSRRGVILIEDCNNSIGSTYKNIKVGNFGDFSVYSFYPNRYLHSIEGAMIVCRSKEYAERAKKLRRFGIDFNSFRDADGEINRQSDIPMIYGSKVLNNLNAAVGIAQFEALQYKFTTIRDNFRKLKTEISALKPIKVIESNINSDPVPWVMFLMLNERDSLLRYLKANGIEASKIHCRNDIYTGFGGSNTSKLNNLDAVESKLIGIPCGWWLCDDDIDYIVESIKNWINWR